jgi:hypothetical protein
LDIACVIRPGATINSKMLLKTRLTTDTAQLTVSVHPNALSKGASGTADVKGAHTGRASLQGGAAAGEPGFP